MLFRSQRQSSHASFLVLIILCFTWQLLDASSSDMCRSFPASRYANDSLLSRPCTMSEADIDDLQSTRRLSIHELTKERGFRLEEHRIVTADEYIINVHRLINPLVPRGNLKGVIILQHGILCSSSLWLMNSTPKLDRPKHPRRNSKSISNSLSIALSNRGYDVWLTNFRGNQYARSHVKGLSVGSKYWDFNVDTLIRHDFSSYIDYILNYTKSSSYSYIGHSLGSTVGIGSLIAHGDKPTIQRQTCSVFMGPVVSTKFIDGSLLPLFRIVTTLYDDLAPFPGAFKTFALFIRNACRFFPRICAWLSSSFVGKDKVEQLKGDVIVGDTEFQNKIEAFSHMMQQSVSVQMLKHIIQVHNSGRLAHYDFGQEQNSIVYGSPNPPNYDLAKIQAPNLKVAIVAAANDVISTPAEVKWILENLRSALPTVELIDISRKPFNHMDLILSNETGPLVNKEILSFLERQNCFQIKQ